MRYVFGPRNIHFQLLMILWKIHAMRKHLEAQILQYGGQSLINLVNHKGHEAPVKEAYEQKVAEV